MTTWIAIYFLLGLVAGCLRQIFRKESARNKFQNVFSEKLEELAKKKKISKWENEERTVFSVDPNADLWTRAVLESKEDVEKTGETFWALALIMGYTILWGPVLILDTLSRIKRFLS